MMISVGRMKIARGETISSATTYGSAFLLEQPELNRSQMFLVDVEEETTLQPPQPPPCVKPVKPLVCRPFPTVDEQLLDDCKPPPPGKRLRTMLHQAIVDCRLPQVRILVDKMGESVNAKDIYGRTPLMLACLLANERQGVALVKLLLARRAKANDTDFQGRTALHYACLGARHAIVVALLADPGLRCIGARDGFGYSALMYAAMRGGPAGVVRELVTAGAPVDERDVLGYTPLLMAIRCGNYAAARVLLTEGHAQTTVRDDEYRRTALDWAMCTHHGKEKLFLKRRQHVSAIKNVCNMYDRIKPFRCRHPQVRRSSAESFCGEQVTRGLPDAFLSQHHEPASCPLSSANPVEVPDGPKARELFLSELKGLRHHIFHHVDCASILAAPPATPDYSSTEPSNATPLTNSGGSPTATTLLSRGPPTPELIIFGRQQPMMQPDLLTIFRLYLPEQTTTRPAMSSMLPSNSTISNKSNLSFGSFTKAIRSFNRQALSPTPFSKSQVSFTK